MAASRRFAALALIAASLAAHEHAPRVLSPNVADTYSLKAFARFDRWSGLEGDAKLYAIYAYLADRRTGIYPMGTPAMETSETSHHHGAITDPIKMLNIYPLGHCATLGPTMAGIIEGMGIGPVRTCWMREIHHVVAEASVGGRWHYLDLDMRAVFRRPDGSLASLDEAKAGEEAAWSAPRGPLFFPLDDVAGVRREFASCGIDHYYGYHTGGHAMDLVLRRGEKLTRWWKPQGGRWNQHPSYAARPFPREVLERAPAGPKCKHASYTIHTYGNGRFDYHPDLTSAADVADGVRELSNVVAGPGGLTLAGAGAGSAVFEVRTPWVIVPLVGDIDDAGDDREASVVEIDAAHAALAVSTDGGASWRDVAPVGRTADLTKLVAGTYGYLLRIALDGAPGEAAVRSLAITTWVQVHPASLPALARGRNAMRYVVGDDHDLASHVVEIRGQGNDRESFLAHLVAPPPDYDPTREAGRAVGAFTVRVDAPPGERIAWFSAGAGFVAAGDRAATANRMEWAAGEPEGFAEFYRAAIPAWHAHWHYNDDREVVLPAPAATVFVRYVGDPGVDSYRIYAHCVADQPCPAGPGIDIEQAWSEGGQPRSHRQHLAGPGGYEIQVDGEPTDEWIALAVPSGR